MTREFRKDRLALAVAIIVTSVMVNVFAHPISLLIYMVYGAIVYLTYTYIEWRCLKQHHETESGTAEL